MSSTKQEVTYQAALKKFKEHFEQIPTAAARAPGRVNLIGDHIDYCDGFVLPVALQYNTVIVGAFNRTSTCNILTVTETKQEWETSFKLPVTTGQDGPGWAQYIMGVVYHFPDKVHGFNAVVMSDVPMGSGVSSSAALEVATFTFLEELHKVTHNSVKKALACQSAEHEFAKMPCGIMDQFISTMGKKDHALLIDCKSLEVTHIPLSNPDIEILVINSNIKHKLTGSEYPLRRSQCQQAAQMLEVKSLRYATTEDLKKLKEINCDPDVLKRAQHVVTEIQRTEEAAEYLKQGNYERVGDLFYQSHESLRKFMEVSCPEMDEIVEICKAVPGVLGARMTGGGFGGCVVALVLKESVEGLKAEIQNNYKHTPTFFICKPSDGASPLVI